jgi:hypothetical protein
MTEAERPFLERAVILWAGDLAQARAKRKNKAGWVLVLSPERERAIHEAAHGVTASVVGQFVHRLSIVPDPGRCLPDERYYSGGFCDCSDREDDDRPVSSRPMRDRSQIALAGWALAAWNVPCRWKSVLATVRMFRQAAETILNQHWPLVLALAGELEQRKTMDRSEIERFTQRVRATAVDPSRRQQFKPARMALLASARRAAGTRNLSRSSR